MAQYFFIEITLPSIGVYQPAARIHCHSIDGQVSSLQVLFKGHIGICKDRESMVTRARFALCARKRVLLTCDWVQKYREVAAHLFKSGLFEGTSCGAHNDPVRLMKGLAQ